MIYIQPLTCKKKVVFLVGCIGFFLYLYVTLFTHEVAEDILLQNAHHGEIEKQSSSSPQKGIFIQKLQSLIPPVDEKKSNQRNAPANVLNPSSPLNNSLVHFPDYIDVDIDTIKTNQEIIWKKWLQTNGYVSVGKYYHHCDNGIQIGEIILTRNDSVNHGIILKSFINATLTESVSAGKLHLDVSFNGIHFLKYSFNMCEKLRKIIKCPISQGLHNIAVAFGLPRFLLKGTYDVKAWNSDTKGRTMACLVSSIII